MFGAKATTPKQLAAIQVLTPAYMLDGYTELDRAEAFFQHHSSSTSLSVILNLSSTRLYALDPRSTPVLRGSSWAFPYGAAVVAVIPRDEASMDFTIKKNAALRYPFPIELCVGPYVMRGNMLSPYTDRNQQSLLFNYRNLVLQAVEIDYPHAETGLATLQAPLAIVHTSLLHGIVLP